MYQENGRRTEGFRTHMYVLYKLYKGNYVTRILNHPTGYYQNDYDYTNILNSNISKPQMGSTWLGNSKGFENRTVFAVMWFGFVALSA